ncbi:MAG: MFS transporter [Mycoplasma sp.]|nr:MFS transporter [Candidatus Hennigella equi]
MSFETWALIVNSTILAIVILGTGLLIWRLKLGSKNKVLLFILFIFYWMAPLMTREYTGQMHIHQGIGDGGSLLWIPLTIYGLVGLAWRPLTDVLSFNMQSRKNVIFMSLAIQLLTLWPMFVWPQLFICNIIQSIGTGVGASGIGLFNLMFSEQEHKRKIFTTVSILVLPILIAEFITSCIEAVLCGLVPEHGPRFDPEPTIYLDYLKWLWLLAIVFIVVSFVITIFIKEDRKTLFHNLATKEPVKNHHDISVVVLVCLAAVCFGFVRWVVSGPSSVTQLIYIAFAFDIPQPNAIYPPEVIEGVKFFEGYLSLVFAIGQLIGAIIAAAFLSRHQNKMKWILILIGALCWWANLIVNINIINVPVFFSTNLLMGLGYGLMYPVFIGIMLNKYFTNSSIVTPIGLYNTSLAFGITCGSAFNNIIKGDIYDFHYTESTSHIAAFDRDNTLVNSVTIGVVLLMLIFFVASYVIHVKHPPIKGKSNIRFNTSGEMEI